MTDWYAKDNCTLQDLDYNSSSPSPCQNISLIMLGHLRDASVVYVVVGFLSALFSLFTIIVIVTDSQLRSKTYFLIANLGFVDLIASVALIYCGVKRLILYSYRLPDVMTQWTCLYQETPIAIGFSGNVIIFLLTAFDRLLAIVQPTWYQNKYPRRLYSAQYVLAYAYMAFEVASLYSGAEFERVVSICVYTTASSQKALLDQAIRGKVVVATTVLLYVFHMFWVRTRLRKAKSVGGDRVRATKSELQVRVLITLICILTAFVLTTTVGHVLYSIALSLTSLSWALKYATYSASFMCVSSCTNFLIMYSRSSDFRNAVRWIIFRRQHFLMSVATSPRTSTGIATVV